MLLYRINSTARDTRSVLVGPDATNNFICVTTGAACIQIATLVLDYILNKDSFII